MPSHEVLPPPAVQDAFRVRLGDALRPIEDPIAIQGEAARLLGEQLRVVRAFYCDVEPDGDHITIHRDYADGVPTMAGRYRVSDFGSFLIEDYRAGRTVAVTDASADPRLDDPERAAYASVGVRAFLCVPLIKGSRIVSLLGVNDPAPRAWKADEVALVQEVAERTWAVVERAKAESALRASEQRLRALVEATSEVMYSMSADWSEMRQLTGGALLSDTTSTNRNWLGDYIPVDEQPRVLAAIREAVHTKSVFELEHLVRRGDGSVGWVFSRAVPILDEKGEIAEWFGAASDVTARKRTEEALRESEARLQRAISIETVGVLFFSLDGRILDANAAFQRMSGYTVEELRTTAHWETLTAHEFIEATARTAQNLAESGETPPYEKVMIRKDGSRWWGLFAPTRLRGSGRESECVEFIIDITERKRAEEALRDADRRKNEFLAMLAHELRNPLAPIRNAVEILKLQRGADSQLETTRSIIERQVNHMVRLIDDLLEVSRITRGKLQLCRETVALQDIINECLDNTRPHVGHNLHISLPQEPIYLEADPTRLAQLFSNLLNNACKYTPRGGNISVSAHGDGPIIVVKVSDDGVGIAAQHLPRLFQMFSQIESSPSGAQGGLGIGLSLAKGITELHGGTIEARSEGLGKGSEFIVRLPIRPGRVSETVRHLDEEKRRTVAGRRILVVDDNVDIASSLSELLELGGNEVETASDGVDALEKAAAWRPEVILLDIGLPKKNGYDVCRAVRAQPWARDTTIIALTGWGQEEDRRKSAEAGFDGHLVKPVSHDALLEMIVAAQNSDRCPAGGGGGTLK